MQTRENGVSGFPIGFLLVSDSDHRTPVMGATPTIEISKNGGAYASPVGTISEVGHGQYNFDADATDLDTSGELWAYITATGADDITAHLCDVGGIDPFNLFLTDAVNGVPGAVWDELVANRTTVGTFGYALGTSLPSELISFNNLIASIPFFTWSEPPSAYNDPDTFGSLLRENIDAPVSGVAASVWAYVLEGTKSAAWFMRIFLAGLAGKVSGASSDHPLFRDLADTKNRIDATTSADGRSNVTLDGD